MTSQSVPSPPDHALSGLTTVNPAWHVSNPNVDRSSPPPVKKKEPKKPAQKKPGKKA
jgi:hypothetical protein